VHLGPAVRNAGGPIGNDVTYPTRVDAMTQSAHVNPSKVHRTPAEAASRGAYPITFERHSNVANPHADTTSQQSPSGNSLTDAGCRGRTWRSLRTDIARLTVVARRTGLARRSFHRGRLGLGRLGRGRSDRRRFGSRRRGCGRLGWRCRGTRLWVTGHCHRRTRCGRRRWAMLLAVRWWGRSTASHRDPYRQTQCRCQSDQCDIFSIHLSMR
jgi:hypothetical protein